MRTRICLALAGLVLTTLAPSAARSARGFEPDEDVFAPLAGDDLQDVLFLGDERPLFVRLHIKLGDKGFHTAWSDFIGRLHRFLDGDGDGVVTVQEAQRGNWPQMVQGTLAGLAPAPPGSGGPAMGSLDTDPKDGQVSLAELMRYIRTTLRYDEVGVQQGPPPDPKAQALFDHLDLDHDGSLSAAELSADATDRCLARLDLNEDELIDLAELKPFENAYATRFQPAVAMARPGSRADTNFVLLGDGSSRLPLPERLLAKYDRGGDGGSAKDGRLSSAELGCPEETLRRFDANGDGALDRAELRHFVGDPVPDVELNVVLERAHSGAGRIALAGKPRFPVATPATGIEVDLGPATVEFAVDDGLPSGNAALIRQFETADTDKNGYVDKMESTQTALVLLQRVFAMADRDGDGKLYKKELEAYIERQSEAIASRMMLSLADRGRALFEMLDTNTDQKLSVRELRQARAHLERLDRDGDGRIAQNEMPRRYRVGVGRGQTPIRQAIAIKAYDASVPVPPARNGGPEWFGRMDRNGDGDVSRREFLGTRDQFRRFDADSDGLIDPREALGKP
jgi:Ca2+-binding EF-hand superfamily protein